MENRYHRSDVLEALYNKALTACDKVFTTSRPLATDAMSKFIVVRLPQGITPYADTHSTAYAQFQCFVRDLQGGVEDVNSEETLVNSIISLFPFNDTLISCNEKPLMLGSTSDGMGFHSVIFQFKIIIKV